MLIEYLINFQKHLDTYKFMKNVVKEKHFAGKTDETRQIYSITQYKIYSRYI